MINHYGNDRSTISLAELMIVVVDFVVIHIVGVCKEWDQT